MPELPEVETIRRVIEPQIAGQAVISVKINHPQIIAHPDAETFAASLTGETFRFMSRRGKFLTFHFDSGARLVLHLRMTGQLLVTPCDFPAEKHTHLIAELTNGHQLRYIDVRRFGRFWFFLPDEQDNISGQNKLGVEPLSTDLTGIYLKEALGKRSKSIKEMLLDQSIVAGIGNIYSDEILYAAKLHPEQKCCELSMRAWNKLARVIPEIIQWGIAADDMSPEEYLAGRGKDYSNIAGLKAYGREGKPCLKCGKTMRKIVIAGRNSCYCPSCQRKKEMRITLKSERQ